METSFISLPKVDGLLRSGDQLMFLLRTTLSWLLSDAFTAVSFCSAVFCQSPRLTLLTLPLWSQITFFPPFSSPIDEMTLLCVLVSLSPYGSPAQYVRIPRIIFHFLLFFLLLFSLVAASPPCTSSQPMYWRWLHLAVPFYFRTTLVAPQPQPIPPPGQDNSVSFFHHPPPLLSLFSVFHFLYSSSCSTCSPLDETALLPSALVYPRSMRLACCLCFSSLYFLFPLLSLFLFV